MIGRKNILQRHVANPWRVSQHPKPARSRIPALLCGFGTLCALFWLAAKFFVVTFVPSQVAPIDDAIGALPIIIIPLFRLTLAAEICRWSFDLGCFAFTLAAIFSFRPKKRGERSGRFRDE